MRDIDNYLFLRFIQATLDEAKKKVTVNIAHHTCMSIYFAFFLSFIEFLSLLVILLITMRFPSNLHPSLLSSVPVFIFVLFPSHLLSSILFPPLIIHSFLFPPLVFLPYFVFSSFFLPYFVLSFFFLPSFSLSSGGRHHGKRTARSLRNAAR